MPLKTHQDEMPAVNLTPMIDIVFQLIIFFMVGARFTEMEQQLDVSVPRVSQTAPLTETPKKRTISIYQDGRLALDGTDCTLPQLQAELQQAQRQYPDLSVSVRGDGESRLQAVADVLAACRDAGIADMAISVKADQRRR